MLKGVKFFVNRKMIFILPNLFILLKAHAVAVRACCSTYKQGWQYGTVRYVGTVRYASIFAKRYGTLVRYAFFVMVRVRYVGTVRLFVMVRVRYVGTLFELKIPYFSYIAPDFCMQRQNTAKSDAKCVN